MTRKTVFTFILIFSMLLTSCGTQTGSSTEETSLAASSATETQTSTETAATTEPEAVTVVSSSDVFSDRDYEVGYDESESTLIYFDGSTISASADNVEISDTTVTITEEGTYILSGTLDDGMVIINTEDTEKVQLVLNGVDIHSETCAPIYILQTDKVFITTAENTTNTLSNGGTFTAIDDNNIDAVIFSKDDVTLNGSGTLIITSPAGHGIVSKDSLTITSGTYDINCASHGLDGKDDVSIANAVFTIVAGKDGIHAENEDDTTSGFIYVQSGTFNITSQGDGISAAAYLQIEDGTFEITSGGGSENAAVQSTDFWGDFMGGGNHGSGMGGKQGGNMMEGTTIAPTTETTGEPDSTSLARPEAADVPINDDAMYVSGFDSTFETTSGDNSENAIQAENSWNDFMGGGEYSGNMSGDFGGNMMEGTTIAPTTETTEETDSTSLKGLKATGTLTINGGTFTINSADDAVHSNGNVSVLGGTFEIAAGDDAFHADETLTISDGIINITESYEGLEGLHILVSGGDVSLISTDDGLNAAGGTDASGTTGGRDGMFGGNMFSAGNGSIVISGGSIDVTASGDGLDANGTLEISGGYVVVSGPTQGDTATLDYDTSAVISGGTFIGTGASGMAQTFSDSQQGVISVSVGNQSAGTEITLTDSNGATILAYTPELSFAVVILSSPDIISGETYTITVGTTSSEFTAS